MAAKGTAKAQVKKESIHPNFRMIKVVDTQGNEFDVASSYSGDTLRLDIDTHTHPAWTREMNYVNESEGKVAKFNDKYSGLSFMKKKN